MPSGPPLIGENRFALLADRSPQSKRKKRNIGEAESNFPSLPTPKVPNPKYVIVSTLEGKKPLSEYSCFAVHRALHLISKDIISISQLRDGKLLLLVKDFATGKKFLDAKSLVGMCEISCKFHEHLNFTKGTIYAPYLSNISTEEIKMELSSQGVVDVFKYERTIDGIKSPSGVVLLTFDLYNLPETLDVSWYKVKVREYFPNPMRCKNCQLLGHTQKRCKGSASCVGCNLPPHEETQCTRIFCANCAENHPSSSNTCKKFIQQKEILKIKTKRKCSLRDALSIYNEQNKVISPTSYSATVSSTPNKSLENSSTNKTTPKTTKQFDNNTNLKTTSQTKEKLSLTQPPSNTTSQSKSKGQTVISKSLKPESFTSTKNSTSTSNTLSSYSSLNFSPEYQVQLSESSSDNETPRKTTEPMSTNYDLSE